MPLTSPNGQIEIPRHVALRAFIRFTPDENGCHISTYSVASHGYAQIGWRGPDRMVGTTAHRAAWVAAHGQIPAGMTVDHQCRNKRCVNPAHLRLLSNFENARRSLYDWPVGTCRNGHPPTELVKAGGRTRCRPCLRETQRRYRRRKAIAA
ncbi:HNH endonuclease signature motif containing protein [Streptomyces griseoluteus]|uniref:HNH endonuclease signature motif containing protein n=1 Tax=Streptomyces griseoluteus TaxID=29306 RepID=UPI0034408159